MPLIVIVFATQLAVTPAGKPVAVPIPVAPVVVKVIGVKTVLIHNTGGLIGAGVTVLLGFTIIVPVAFTELHPPVNGIL